MRVCPLAGVVPTSPFNAARAESNRAYQLCQLRLRLDRRTGLAIR
jgi:hypothetical protein